MAGTTQSIEVHTDALHVIAQLTSAAKGHHRQGHKGEAVDAMQRVHNVVREQGLQHLYSVQYLPPRLRFKRGVDEESVKEEPMGGSFTRVTYSRERPARASNRR